MSTRMIAGGLTALALAGSSILTAGAVSGAGAAEQARTAAAPTCQNAQMKAGYKYDSSAAGHRYGFIVLQNTGTTSCTIHGFGGLSYVGDGNGTQIGRAAVRRGTTYTKTVAPGQRVRSPIDERPAGNFGNCRPHKVDGFRVYIPQATKSQYIAHPTTGCLNSTVPLLTHGSYR